jgi:phosphatidylglycerophosphate synthase
VLVATGLARQHTGWLWASSAVIGGQYITDALDGKLGTLRKAGLVKWGFYMDHLLDYLFLCSILLGYTMLVPARFQWLMSAILAVASGFMVSSFLACSLTGQLQISYFKVGPIEVRLVLIGVNAWLALGGQAALAVVLPLVLFGSLGILAVMAYQTQRQLWTLDARASQEAEAAALVSAPAMDGIRQPSQRMEPTVEPSSME